MAFIKYTGLAHFRELLVEDFQKVGVEVDQMITFARHEVVKVSDEVAGAIHKLVGDEFEEVRGDVQAELVRDTAVMPAPEPVPPVEPSAESPA